MKRFFILTILPLIGIALIAQSFVVDDDWQDKVEPALLNKIAETGSADFLVLFSENADLNDAQGLDKDEKALLVYDRLQAQATQSQANVIDFLEAQEIPYQTFFIINMIHAKGDADLLQSIAEMPEVHKIQTNPVAKTERLQPAISGGARTVTWGIEMINADDVWALGYTGQGVIVGGQDTGYEWEHPALKEKYRGWDGTSADHNYNWHDAVHEQNPLNDDDNNPCGFDSPFPCDDNNHGTHTMGTMVGADGDMEIGVAPDSKWIACRNMERGWGMLTTYVECFEWFLAPTDLNGENPDPTQAPHVIANSWSCPEVEGCNPDNFDIMETAVNNLKAAGTVVVVSAGNSGNQGCSTVNTPASIFENSYTVGATNEADNIAGFSSRGPVTVDGSNRLKPNVSAPGTNVLSSIRNGEYASFNGTSMAGPHVAGAVALVISSNPALAGDVETIEDILEQSAVSKTTDEDCGETDGEEIPNNTYGYGRIDALAAVEAALALISNTDETDYSDAVKVAPNPFNDAVHFSFLQNLGETTVEIYDVSGKILRAEQQNISGGENLILNLSGTASGVYFYHLRFEDGTLEGKILKQ